MPRIFDYEDKTLGNGNDPVVGTRMVIVPQSTPDGRVVPMPQYPSVITPHACTTTRIEQHESTEHGFASAPTDRYPDSPYVGNTMHTMGPPPNRHAASTNAPAEIIITKQSSTHTSSHTATTLFANEGPPCHSEKDSDSSTAVKETLISNEDSVGMNDHDARIDDTNKMNNEDREDFHQRHQRFVTMIRDIHDIDQKFQDMMFDGSLHIDVAKALLLQMKCETFEVTHQILAQLDYANVALREFLPHGVEQE